jgi:hypothetical protein
MKIATFWNIAPCSPYTNRRFGGHLQSRKQERSRGLGQPPVTRWFLVRPIFNPEDSGNIFLRNVGSYTDHMGLYSRRLEHSWKKICIGETGCEEAGWILCFRAIATKNTLLSVGVLHKQALSPLRSSCKFLHGIWPTISDRPSVQMSLVLR